MKKLLLLIAVLLVATPIMAKEIDVSAEPAYGVGTIGHFYSLPPAPFPTENELSNDNGTASMWWTSGMACNTITIPYDCWLVRVKFFTNCPGSSGAIEVDVFEDSGVGSKPTNPATSLIGGSITWPNDGVDEAWKEVDLPSPVFFTNGTIVHPGQDSGTSGNCGIHMDTNASGTLGLWHWSSGDWQDWTSSYGHFMARLIVNDDADGPYADQLDPADGDTAPPDTDINFHILDNDIGVDSTTIDASSVVVEVDGNPVSGTLDVDDSNPNDVVVTFDPDSDFTVGDTVDVTLSPSGSEILDLLTNAMAEFSYSFSIAYVTVQPTSLGYIKAMYE